MRAKSPALTAVPVVTDQDVTLPDGQDVTARTGEWLIAKDDQVIDVVSPFRFQRLYEPIEDRGLVVSGPLRSRIERTLGMGSTETPEHLATAIERSARLVIGDVRVDFTPGQWEYLAHKAEKRGITVDALVRQIVDWMTSEMWQHI